MTEPTSTADYRKYPKGPNFLLIVLLSAAFILLFGAAAFLFLSDTGRKLLPGVPRHPNSSVRPANPIYLG